jgi:hypothetical protein
MTRAQLEHVIRAAATIADDDEIVIIGSQSVLGEFPLAPECLEIHDLLISKYVAGREKDDRFVRGALRHKLADPTTLIARLDATAIAPEHQRAIRERIAYDSSLAGCAT